MVEASRNEAKADSLTFVIVTYNTRELLRKCLASILAEASSSELAEVSSVRIVVVDNASSDGTQDMLRDEFPSVRLIANPDNLGPAKGFNLGLAEALNDAEFVVVMNSDIVILPGTVQHMMAFLKANPHVDGVSVPLFYPDMSPQKTRTHIARLLPINKRRPFRADFPGTTFAMIRARAFRKVGGYDENYYFYNEDLDWASRAKAAGCVFYHLPDASAIHAHGQGRKQNVSRIVAELYKSNIYYYKRHYPRLAWLALVILRLEISWRIRALRRGLERVTDPQARRSIEESMTVYAEARRRMEEEYPRNTRPRIPMFA
ncbi:MAG: glycosyltransferase family 2 protein [Betaproteobacteria bacterium]